MYTNVGTLIHNWQNLVHPKRPQAAEWINQVWYNRAMEYPPVTKRLRIPAPTSGHLENSVLSKKAKYRRVHTLWFHLYDVQGMENVTYSDRNQCLPGVGMRSGNRLQGVTRARLGVAEMLSTSIGMCLALVYICCEYRWVHSWYVNYASRKFILKVRQCK